MFGNRQSGIALIILGVLGNNYIFVHDLLFEKAGQEGFIVVGWLSAILILASWAVIAVGLKIVVSSQPSAARE